MVVMSKRRRSKRPVSVQVVDVISQVQCAARNPRAALLGGLLGGVVPWIGQAIAHHDVGNSGAWYADPHALVVLGCMVFSMTTVYLFGRAAFKDARKAVGFVAAMELAMVASSLWYVQAVTLAAIVAINAISTGAGIALAHEATTRRKEADERRSRTRAQTRARKIGDAAAPRAVPVRVPAKPIVIEVTEAIPAARPGVALALVS